MFFLRSRILIILLAVILFVLIVATVVLIVLYSLKPCIFVKCHSKTTKCIRRGPFRAQCICNSETVGNGRTVCDECGIRYEPISPRIIGGSDAMDHSWPFAALIRQKYKTLIRFEDQILLVNMIYKKL